MRRRKGRTFARRENKKIASERISILFQLARKVLNREQGLAQHYVDLARKISMRYKVRLSCEFRRKLCRHCKTFMLPGKNCIVRIRQKREPHVVITCLSCGGHMRIPLKAKLHHIKMGKTVS